MRIGAKGNQAGIPEINWKMSGVHLFVNCDELRRVPAVIIRARVGLTRVLLFLVLSHSSGLSLSLSQNSSRKSNRKNRYAR